MGGKSTKVVFQRFSYGYRAESVRVSVPWNTLVSDILKYFPRHFFKHCPEGFEPCYYLHNDDPLNLDDYDGMTLQRAIYLIECDNNSEDPLVFSVRFVPIPRQQPTVVNNIPLASTRSPFQRSSTQQKLSDLAAQLTGPERRSYSDSDDDLMGPIVRSRGRPHLSSSSSSSSTDDSPSQYQGDAAPFSTARDPAHSNMPKEMRVELFLFIESVLVNTLTVIKDNGCTLASLKNTARRSFGLGGGTMTLTPRSTHLQWDSGRLASDLLALDCLALGCLTTDNSFSANVIYRPVHNDPIYTHRAYVDAMDKALPQEVVASAEKPSSPPVEPNESNDRPAKDDEEACTVCMDNVIQICIVPCGHHAFCISCADKLNTCSICRGRIELRQRVFKP